MAMAPVSEINEGVLPAEPDEFPAVALGSLKLRIPVILAPMAGITNTPFRTLCREFGAGLYVSGMITARALVERNPRTLQLASFGPEEQPRSLQLYGVDPHYVGEAVAFLVGEGMIDHLDMNFGCPVRKVTRKGGGAAIPAKPKLLANIVRAAVKHAGNVPVTIKFRVGINDEVHTYLDSGKVAEQEGCAAVALHARTAAQLYDGEADWERIAELKRALTIPVFGNGDIWEAWDALRMIRQTGCDGVVVGRGCLGRPWLFRDLADVFAGRMPQTPPRFGEVTQIMLRHARLLADWQGERWGVRAFRKQSTWYTKGFAKSAKLRAELIRINTVEELETVLSQADPNLEFPASALRVPRGKKSGRQRVALPEGYLENRFDDDTPPVPAAEDEYSGG